MSTALVVDDDRGMVRTLTDILRLRGWDVENAFTGEEAVAAVTRRAFDVVLMDVKMPGMNGVSAFRAMRSRRPALRVILMTAYTRSELLAEAEQGGAMQVLSKPLNLPRLFELFDAALAGARSVLVVDDDADYLRTLSDVLAGRGYPVLTAATLDEAVAHAAGDHPGVVILHMHLDNVVPQRTMAAIRAANPSIALIVYSGRPDLEAAAAAAPDGLITATLRKPFPIERLLELLDEVLGG